MTRTGRTAPHGSPLSEAELRSLLVGNTWLRADSEADGAWPSAEFFGRTGRWEITGDRVPDHGEFYIRGARLCVALHTPFQCRQLFRLSDGRYLAVVDHSPGYFQPGREMP